MYNTMTPFVPLFRLHRVNNITPTEMIVCLGIGLIVGAIIYYLIERNGDDSK